MFNIRVYIFHDIPRQAVHNNHDIPHQVVCNSYDIPHQVVFNFHNIPCQEGHRRKSIQLVAVGEGHTQWWFG